MTTVALQAQLEQNLTFSGSLRQNLTAFTLSGHLAVSFLPDLSVADFLLRLFTDPVAWNLCPTINLVDVNAVRDSVARSLTKLSFASSVPAAERWSFGTCALRKLSFKLETSNLQFFLLLSYLLPGNVIIFGVTGQSNKLSVCIWVACIVRHPVSICAASDTVTSCLTLFWTGGGKFAPPQLVFWI